MEGPTTILTCEGCKHLDIYQARGQSADVISVSCHKYIGKLTRLLKIGTTIRPFEECINAGRNGKRVKG